MNIYDNKIAPTRGNRILLQNIEMLRKELKNSNDIVANLCETVDQLNNQIQDILDRLSIKDKQIFEQPVLMQETVEEPIVEPEFD